MKKFIKYMALMLALVMCISMFASCKSKDNTPKEVIEKEVVNEEEIVNEVVNNFFDAMIGGEMAKAAEYVYDEQLKSELELIQEEFDLYEDYKTYYVDEMSDVKFRISETDVSDDTAVVKVIMSKEGTADEPTTVELKKVDDKWMIGYVVGDNMVTQSSEQ